MSPGELKTLRVTASLTQRQLAKEIGCTFQHMSRMENGHAEISRPIELAIRYVCEPSLARASSDISTSVTLKLEAIAREMGWLQ